MLEGVAGRPSETFLLGAIEFFRVKGQLFLFGI
jgi:hypothetical protein